MSHEIQNFQETSDFLARKKNNTNKYITARGIQTLIFVSVLSQRGRIWSDVLCPPTLTRRSPKSRRELVVFSHQSPTQAKLPWIGETTLTDPFSRHMECTSPTAMLLSVLSLSLSRSLSLASLYTHTMRPSTTKAKLTYSIENNNKMQTIDSG